MDTATYGIAISNYTQTPEFAALDNDAQQEGIKSFRNGYLAKYKDANIDDVNFITEEANKSYLRDTGRGRAIPKININLPNQEEGWDDLKEKEKREKIQEFRNSIPEIAATNPTQREDTEHFLKQTAAELDRRNDGEDTGRIHSLGSGLMQGIFSNLAEGVGATDTAESVRAYFHENPKYDENLSQQFAEGLGSAVSSIAIIVGAAATTKGLGGSAALAGQVGTLASLGSNGIMRYNQAYKNAIDAGMNEDEAGDAGISALPAAVVDVVGDRLMAGKFLPAKYNKVFEAGTEAEKKVAWKELMKNASLKGKAVSWARSAIGEGTSEAAGDYLAAYGPYLQNDDNQFIPTDAETGKSFLLGAMIGGSISATTDARDLIGNKKSKTETFETGTGEVKITPKYSSKTERDLGETQRNLAVSNEKALNEQNRQSVYKLMAEGKYKQARVASDAMLEGTYVEPVAKADKKNVVEVGPDLQQPPMKQTKGKEAEGKEAKEETEEEININDPEENRKLNGWGAQWRLAKIAARDNVDLKSLTREQYADYATENNLKIDDNQLRMKPDLRGKQSMDEYTKAINELTPKTQDQTASVTAFHTFGKEMSKQAKGSKEIAPGVTPVTTNKSWLSWKINEGIKSNSKSVPKAYVGFKDPYVSMKPERLKEFMLQLQQAGFKGQLKVPKSLYDASYISDQMVINANNSKDVRLAKKLAKSFFGEEIGFEDQGKDSDSQSHSQILAQKIRERVDGAAVAEASESVKAAQEAADLAMEKARKAMGMEPNPEVKYDERPFYTPEIFFDVMRDKLPRSQVKAFNQMLADIKSKNPDVVFTTVPRRKLDASGYYAVDTNEIYINPIHLTNIRVIGHEVAHALTVADIQKYVESRIEGTYQQKMDAAAFDPATPAHIKSLINIYYHTAKALGHEKLVGNIIDSSNLEKAKGMSMEQYAMTSLREFVAEAMASQEFQNALSNIPYNGKTVWQTIVEAISDSMKWMKGVLSASNSAEMVMRNDGENALVATLAAARAIIDSKNELTQKAEFNRRLSKNEKLNFLPVNQTSKLDELWNAYKNIPEHIELERLRKIVSDTWTTDIDSQERKDADLLAPKIKELRDKVFSSPENKAWFEEYQKESQKEKISEFNQNKGKMELTRESWDSPTPYKIDFDDDRSPESVRAAMFSVPTHSTDIEDLESILENGLSSGSALDLTKDKEWAQTGVTVVVPTAKKGAKIEHNNYRMSSGISPVGRVIVDGTNYSKNLTERLTTIASRFPQTPIELIEDDGFITVIKPKININSDEDLNFLPASLVDSNVFRFSKQPLSHDGDKFVKIGNSQISQSGLINESRFQSATQIPKEVFGLIKQVYPEAWTGENVDVNKLRDLEKSRPLFETHVYGQNGSLNPTKEEYDELRHDYETEGRFPSFVPDLEDGGLRTVSYYDTRTHRDTGPIEVSEDEYARALRFNELGQQVASQPYSNSGPRATDFYNSISPFDTEKYPVVRIDVTVPISENKRSQTVQNEDGTWSPVVFGRPDARQIHKTKEAAELVYAEALWRQDDLHENLPNTLGWAMVQFVPDPRTGETVMFLAEQQSRWGQEKAKWNMREDPDIPGKFSVSYRGSDGVLQMRTNGKTKQEAQDYIDQKVSSSPLLDLQHKLVLKAAMDEARKRGVTKMVVSDGETAMMTEKHDAPPRYKTFEVTVNGQSAQFRGGSSATTEFQVDDLVGKHHPRSSDIKFDGKIIVRGGYDYRHIVAFGSRNGFKDTWDIQPEWYEALGIDFKRENVTKAEEPSQAGGMRQHYDSVLQSAAEKMTRSKGEVVDMGVHKNAPRMDWQDVPDGSPESFNRVIGSPVFRNSDGTPKATATGKMYNLSPVDDVSFLPFTKQDSEDYLDLVKSNATDLELQVLINKAAESAGFDSSTSYMRGDETHWEEGTRPIYLTKNPAIAKVFASSPESANYVRKFFIKKNLRIARVGDMIGDVKLTTSSYVSTHYQYDINGKANPKINAKAILDAGYDAIEGTLDGGSEVDHEIVILDPANVKLADPITWDLEHMPIDPAKRFNLDSVNINYLPHQNRSKTLIRGFTRLNDILKGKLTDKFDSNTHAIIGYLSGIKNSDIYKLDNELQDFFFHLVDNIYESRKSAVTNPQIRIESKEMADKLAVVKKAIDARIIAKMMEDYEGLIDFDELEININDRDAIEAAINEWAEENDVETQLAKATNKAKAKKRLEQIYQNWRDQFNALAEITQERFVDAENYVAEMEAMEGEIKAVELSDFLKAHFDYLHNVDVSGLEGRELYAHFFALNNLHDGSFGGLRVTVAYLANQRNANENIGQFAAKFRDPVIDKTRMLQALDGYNRFAELHQVELQRISNSDAARQWMQEQFLGRLYDGVVRTSYNRKLEYTNDYLIEKEKFEAAVGRKINSEDHILTAIFGRLSQFKVGENPDVALARNIKKERDSIQNTMDRSSNPEYRSMFRTKIKLLFEVAVDGLEGVGSMQTFMETFDKRIAGSEPLKVGIERRKLLSAAQEIFSRFNAESKIISEGIHKKVFKKQYLYIPNDAMRVRQGESVEGELDDALTDDELKRKSSLTKVESRYMERSEAMGKEFIYSYNNEYILARNVERMAVDNATIVERLIIQERLKKGSELHQIISTDSVGGYHPSRADFIESMAMKLYKNAAAKGAAPEYGLNILREITSIYAKPTLSSIHHIVTQPLAALVDYSVRTGNLQGWLSAASYYAQNFDKMNQWFDSNQKWTGNRMALEAQALDMRRNPHDDSSEKLSEQPTIKMLNKIYEGAGKVMTFFIQRGDNFATKVTVLAEYERMLKAKGYKYNTLDDVDFGTVEGRILTQATLNAEKNINTSNKILRGELFTDRSVTTTLLRNLLFAFAAHSTSLATQTNQAIRDLAELKAIGAPASEMESKVRTLAAITSQQVVFTSARFAIGAMTAKLMIGLIQGLFDDEEGKIAELAEKVEIARLRGNRIKVAEAEHELANAKTVRAAVTKMRQNAGSTSLFKQILRDGTGAFHLSMNSGAVQQAIYFVPDAWMSGVARAGQEAVSEDLAEQIKTAKELGNLKAVGRLTEQKTIIDGAEYIPMAYPITNTLGLGGLYGSVADNYKRVITEGNQASRGVTEWDATDFVIAVSALGIGQSELNKTMNAIDKIQDKQWKADASFEDTKLPKAKEAQEKKDKNFGGGFSPPKFNQPNFR